MRNLTKTLTAVSLMAPVGAFPLGVGDIKLHSSLNQHLNAEIALNLMENESIEDIRVDLASYEKFHEVGVPWTAFLAKIKFEPHQKADGSVIIKLSSKEVLKEPFLDFLLKVSWPEGNIYREFTVLVDPPTVYQQPTVQIAVTDKSTADATVTSKSITTQPNNSPQFASNSEFYGPTSRLDTLWKIAEKVRPSTEVSVEQMMMGLLEVNPDAFIRGNVNALKTDKTLRIPQMDVILKLTHRQARAEFKKHNTAWRGSVTEKPEIANNKAEKPVSELVENQPQLHLIAPAEEEINQNVDVTPAVSETLSAVEDTAGAALNQQADTAADTQALEERLGKLEQQLAVMQQMLQIKDEQLKALQDAQVKQPIQAAVEKAKPETATPVKQVAEKPQAQPKPKPKSKPVAKTKPAVKPAPRVAPEPESNLFTYILAAGGLLLLGAFGWLWKRKKEAEQEETLSMFASSSEISLPETDEELSVPIVEDAMAGIDVGTVGESSFLSEFTPSDFDAFETEQNEVDPISEADVYLAYGRYQQAEELMRQAINDQPSNDECKIKLLEIFYANENMEEFENYAGELVANGANEKPEFWNKVQEMGSELCPESALFKSELTADASIPVSADEGKADFEETVLAQPLQQEEQNESEQVDFDLASFETPEAATEENPAPINVADEDSGLDFDLGETGEQTVLQEPATADTDLDFQEEISLDAVAEEHSEAVEFDLSSSDEPAVEETLHLDADEVADASENFDAAESSENFDFETLNEAQEASESSGELPEFDFSFDMENVDAASVEQSSSEEMQMDNAVSDLTDMDEMETKIDLAKAYIDMGDESAAKNITEEVLANGSDKQKQEAQAILEKLQ